jgi:LysR family transcriptional regulator, glycine cleavage system transcriptional activator
MKRLPPLAELRAFEAAARRLSFKAAAEELGVTPTAISHQIRLLEADCGQLLFRRRPRPLALTPAGVLLAPGVTRGLQSFTDAWRRLDSAGEATVLRVTATNAFASRCLVPLIRTLRATHPTLKLEIIGIDTVLSLQSGEVDVAIRYARKAPQDGVALELARDTFYAVASPSLLGSKARKLSLPEILRLPLIETGWPDSDAEAPRWSRWIEKAGVATTGRQRKTNAPTLFFREELHAIQAVIEGQGVGICSDILVRRELASGQLVRVSDVTLDGYGFFFVHRRGDTRKAALAALRASLMAAVRV